MRTETWANASNQESITSNPNQFSDDSWNLIIKSQDIAKQWKHLNLDVEHLIQVLFNDNFYKQFVDSLPIDSNLLLDQLEEFLVDQPIKKNNEFFIGDSLETLLDNADHCRAQWGSKLIEISHLLIALGRDKRIGSELFTNFGLTREKLETELRRSTSKFIKSSHRKSINNDERSIESEIDRSSAINLENKTTTPKLLESSNSDVNIRLDQEPKAIESYGRDLTNAAAAGELDPVIGRDSEIRRLIKVLSRRGKNNPVLIGSPGVGKTAIAELLAQRIITNEVPDYLKGLKLIALDLGALIAGAKFRGQFEERFRSVLSEASDPDSGVILFIDELHTLIGKDKSINDAGSILKPILARGEIRCIGATTPEDYKKNIEKDPGLNRRFQQVIIKEPSLDLSIEIVRGIKEKYELHHSISITDKAVVEANRLANRYINDRCLPDKAIDLIDEAAAQLKIDITAKPTIIEETESQLNTVENLLLSKTDISKEKYTQLQDESLILKENLSKLMSQWELENQLIKKINQHIEEEENIKEEITEAENDGDLEEASRLQYDQLYFLQKKLNEAENTLEELRASGNALLRDKVEPEDIADVVARWTGIPVQRVLAGERQKLLNLELNLSNKVVGQKEAVQAVSAAIRRARAGMKDPRRPVGSFLFLGPTGVGKTELAKSLASYLFDEEEALVRLDMSEFMERNAVARLIGAPPGYVGYEEGGQLTEAVSRKPYAVLLLDEIEKAHPDVFNLLLQVLDDGRLSDSQGRLVDFKNTVIVMTSNLASREILYNSKLSQSQKSDLHQSQGLKDQIDEALGKSFRPEFLNRIDEIIRFHPLGAIDLQRIVRLQVNELGNLLAEQGLELRVDEDAIEAIAKEGYEPEYGARPLKRVLRRKMENPLATQLLEEKYQQVRAIRVKAPKNPSESLLFLAED